MEQRRKKGEDIHYVFMDTGAEHPKTYDFIRNIVRHWGIPLTCLRVNINPELGKGNGHSIVPVGALQCDLYPWRDMMSKYGVPYLGGAFCTRVMKFEVFERYCKETFGEYGRWVGIRADEPVRLRSRKPGYHYLADISDCDKQAVLEFWDNQPFNLEIPAHLGNCVFCVKKNPRKIALAARDAPVLAEQFLDAIYHPDVKQNARAEQGNRIMYRGGCSLKSIIALFNDQSRDDIAKTIRGDTDLDGCSESCEIG